MKVIANLDINFRSVDYIKKGTLTTTLTNRIEKIYCKYVVYCSTSKEYVASKCGQHLVIKEVNFDDISKTENDSFYDIRIALKAHLEGIENSIDE